MDHIFEANNIPYCRGVIDTEDYVVINCIFFYSAKTLQRYGLLFSLAPSFNPLSSTTIAYLFANIRDSSTGCLVVWSMVVRVEGIICRVAIHMPPLCMPPLSQRNSQPLFPLMDG